MSKQPKAQPEARKKSRLPALCRRVGVPLAAAACLAVSWWSVLRLRPLEAEATALNQQIAKLAAGIDTMTASIAKWGAPEAVEERYREGTNQVMEGTADVQQWVERITAAQAPLAFEIKVQFDAPVPQPWTNLNTAMLSATLEARPAVGVPGRTTPFQRLLDLNKLVTDSPKRVDLVGLEVQGLSNSVSEAKLHVHLWARNLPPP